MFPDLTRDDVFRIETRRLWLRWPCARDAETIVRLAGERDVAEMTARIPHPIDPGGIDTFVIAARAANTEGQGLTMALAARAAPAALIGLVSIEPDVSAEGPHLGYWLGRAHWGQGLMGEAACAIVNAYFAYAGGEVLTSDTLPENVGSRRVLERCGFLSRGTCVRDFPARGGARQVDRFQLTRADWQRRGTTSGEGP